MKLAVLFSGGKDSTYALHKAMKEHEVVCLITMQSVNLDSYMFHTPNINMTEMQAEAIGLPLITVKTKGVKEKELDDLKGAIEKAVDMFKIEGIVTGAIESVYQASRVQKICQELDLWCFNPLWQRDQVQLLNELVDQKFEVILSSVAAYPFDQAWLGRKLDKKMISELVAMQKKYKINPSGEGGEFESLVLSGPVFKKSIKIVKASKRFKDHAGRYEIDEAILE